MSQGWLHDRRHGTRRSRGSTASVFNKVAIGKCDAESSGQESKSHQYSISTIKSLINRKTPCRATPLTSIPCPHRGSRRKGISDYTFCIFLVSADPLAPGKMHSSFHITRPTAYNSRAAPRIPAAPAAEPASLPLKPVTAGAALPDCEEAEEPEAEASVAWARARP